MVQNKLFLESKRLIGRTAELKAVINHVVKEYESYLADGAYHITYANKLILFQHTPEAQLFLNRISAHLTRNSFSLKKKVYSFLRNTAVHLAKPRRIHILNNGEVRGRGQLIMVTYQGDVKIFDFVNHIVLNKINDFTEYTHRKETHHKIQNHFMTPVIAFVDSEQLILEKYIDFQSINTWNKGDKQQLIKDLFEQYTDYLASVSVHKQSSIHIEEFLSVITHLAPRHALVNIIKECLSLGWENTEFPVVRGHGDFCFKNILVDDENTYVIDWEQAQDNSFFYDLLYFFLEEANEGNVSLLKRFLEGKYDYQFQRVFALFEYTFHTEYRKQYLMITILEQVYRLKDNENEESICFYLDEHVKIAKYIRDF